MAKDFINEFSRLLELFTIKTVWEPVALGMFVIFVPLMLQRPSSRSKTKENSKYLAARLQKWSDSKIDELLEECRTIQKHMKKGRKSQAGSGGPSKVDAEMWKRLLCNKSYGKSSILLCQSIETVTKRICQEDVPSSFLHHLLSCRLIPLKKDPNGVRPIGIGEVVRRLMAKAVARLLKHDIQQATGPQQACAGLDGGIEATVQCSCYVQSI